MQSIYPNLDHRYLSHLLQYIFFRQLIVTHYNGTLLYAKWNKNIVLSLTEDVLKVAILRKEKLKDISTHAHDFQWILFWLIIH